MYLYFGYIYSSRTVAGLSNVIMGTVETLQPLETRFIKILQNKRPYLPNFLHIKTPC